MVYFRDLATKFGMLHEHHSDIEVWEYIIAHQEFARETVRRVLAVRQ